LKCAGCGAELQFEDPKKPGFIPRDVFEKKLAEGKEILCQRCFRLKHYGKYEPIELSSDFKKELKTVLSSFDMVLWVIDITDFEGSYREDIKSLLKNKKVIYVINKIDLLPKAVSYKELKDWLKKRIKTEHPEDIRLVSSKTGFGINSLKKHILSFDDNKALIIGISNTGKSSLVNRLAEHTTLVSPLPGTTLGMLRRKLKSARFYIFDTPGITTKDRAIDLLDIECQHKIAKSDRLTRKTFKIDQKRALLVGGMAFITVNYEGELKPIFQIFTYENVVLHETNLSKALELWKERRGDFLIPPCRKDELENVDFKESHFCMVEEKELVMPGLFWINVKRGPFKIKILHPEKVTPKLRSRLIKPKR